MAAPNLQAWTVAVSGPPAASLLQDGTQEDALLGRTMIAIVRQVVVDVVGIEDRNRREALLQASMDELQARTVELQARVDHLADQQTGHHLEQLKLSDWKANIEKTIEAHQQLQRENQQQQREDSKQHQMEIEKRIAALEGERSTGFVGRLGTFLDSEVQPRVLETTQLLKDRLAAVEQERDEARSVVEVMRVASVSQQQALEEAQAEAARARLDAQEAQKRQVEIAQQEAQKRQTEVAQQVAQQVAHQKQVEVAQQEAHRRQAGVAQQEARQREADIASTQQPQATTQSRPEVHVAAQDTAQLQAEVPVGLVNESGQSTPVETVAQRSSDVRSVGVAEAPAMMDGDSTQQPGEGLMHVRAAARAASARETATRDTPQQQGEPVLQGLPGGQPKPAGNAAAMPVQARRPGRPPGQGSGGEGRTPPARGRPRRPGARSTNALVARPAKRQLGTLGLMGAASLAQQPEEKRARGRGTQGSARTRSGRGRGRSTVRFDQESLLQVAVGQNATEVQVYPVGQEQEMTFASSWTDHVELTARALFASHDQLRAALLGPESSLRLAITVTGHMVRKEKPPNAAELEALMKIGAETWMKEKEASEGNGIQGYLSFESVVSRLRTIAVVGEHHGMMQHDLEDSGDWNIRQGASLMLWNTHFAALWRQGDELYLIDTLGYRLRHDCRQAYVLHFDSSSRVTFPEQPEGTPETLETTFRQFMQQFVGRDVVAAVDLAGARAKQDDSYMNSMQKFQVAFYHLGPKKA